MSLFSEYLHEREGYETIESVSGFAAYKIEGDECYLRDIYVQKANRKAGEASLLADTVCDLARNAGCTKLVGSVCVGTANATASMKVLLAYGMEVSHIFDDVIYFKKEL